MTFALTRRCARCRQLVIDCGGTWYAYPLAHGPGSGLLMDRKRICRTRWIFLEDEHVVADL